MSDHVTTSAPDRSAELALLVEQLSAKLEAGERLDLESVLRRHPEHAAELRDLLPAVALMVGLSRSGPAGVAAADGEPLGELGDFRIVREVGRGGMGVVYEAEQISLGRRVALKVLPYAGAMDARQLTRFKNEAKAAASLRHEHIVQVHAIGCERGVHFYAMEFIDGQTLAEVIHGLRGGDRPATDVTQDFDPAAAGAPTPPVAALSTEHTGRQDKQFYRRAAELIADAADALEHAHSLGIVHRDVKPGNLLVDDSGKVYVGDFGLARFGPDAGLTMSGDLIGTLRYMAPEQALARHGLADHRVDVYGLGATLYELLTGRPAVDGTDRAEVLRRIAFEDPTPPRKLDKAIPAELETITLKCLAKNPAERYATAGDLAADLRRWLEDKPITAKPPTVFQRTARRVRRHPRAVAAAFAVLLLAAVGAFAGAVLIDRQKQRAEGAYAQVRLALDDLSSQVIDDWLAKQPALTEDQKRFLERALGHYEWLAGHAGDDAATRAGVAAAYLRVGDIRAKLGQMADAGAAYGRAVELYRRLADEFPAEPAYRLALAKAYRGRGTALQRLGRYGDAEPAYRQALALHERFVIDAPAESEYRAELAGTLLDYGDLLRQAGRRTEAEGAYRRGLGLVQGPAGRTPDALYRLGQLHVRLGAMMYWSGHYAEAEQPTRRGVEALEELLKAAGAGPGTGPYREALADGWTELAHTLGTVGLNRPAEAEAADRRAVDVWDKLTADFPAVPEYRHRLARSVYGLGNHLTDQGRYSDAQAEYRRAVALLKKLVADYPREPRYLEDLAKTVMRSGVVSNRAGQPAEAEQAYRQATRAYREVAGMLPENARAHTDLGRALAEQGDADGAIAEYREAIRLQPDNAASRLSLGVALATKGDHDGAIAEYREAIRLDPDNSSAHTNLGAELSNVKRDYDGAIAYFRRAIALRPDEWRARTNLGITLERSGRYAAAEPAFREALKLKPDSAQDHGKLGMVLHRLGRTDEAIAECREAIRLNPDDWSGHIKLGCLLCDEKHDYEGAAACFRRAIALDPSNENAHYDLGNALRHKGQLDGAITEYREAIRLKADFAAAYSNLGYALAGRGEPAEAEAACRKAIELKPDYAEAFVNLGRALEKQGKPAEAETACRRAIELKPELVQAHNSLGAVLSNDKRDYAGAVAAFRRAIALDPNDAVPHANLGITLKKMGQTDAAVAEYREAIRIDPRNSKAYINLGAILSNVKGDYDGAIACFRRAIALRPDDWQAHDNLGITLERAGQYAAAEAAFREADRLQPNEARRQEHRAWHLAACPDVRLRDPKQAVAAAKKAVELEAQSGGYWNTLGVAYYRNGEYKAAVEALGRSMKLKDGGDGADWFFLAMAHWQLDEKEDARRWYDKAAAWTDKNRPDDAELRRFRAEAEELLGLRPTAGP